MWTVDSSAVNVVCAVIPCIVFQLQAVAVVKAVWVPPRTVLHENVDYTHQESVGQVSYCYFPLNKDRTVWPSMRTPIICT